MSQAAEAAQRAGARYDGRLPGNRLVSLEVSPDGSRLAGADFDLRLSCNDGRRLDVVVVPTQVSTITPAGVFGFTGVQSLTTRRPSGRRVTGTLTISVSGSFSASGESAAGSGSASFTSSTVSCSSGSFPFTVYLDGTRGAPFRTARLATGRYRMSVRGRGLRFVGPLRTFAPTSEMLLLRTRSRVGCQGGTSFPGADDFVQVPLVRGAAVVRRRFRVRRGPVVSRVRSRLALRFYRRGSYRVRGTWRVSATVFRDGRRVNTCQLRKRFTGRFQSGPANLF